MPSTPKSLWQTVKGILKIQHDLPVELSQQFVEFKDIKSIDRIRVASWIALGLTFCLFILDFFRYWSGGFEKYPYYHTLFYLHILGLLFIVPAVYITKNKTWIIEKRSRRGVIIWGMVLLSFIFLLGQALVVYTNRGSTTMYMGFVFAASWMFAMSHKERMLFFIVTLTLMFNAILLKPDIGFDMRLVNFIEVFFLSLMAFFFDWFDYNTTVSSFINLVQIEKKQKHIEQLESFKSRFFTNLTHEFRTPLTTIMGMSREIAEDPKRWSREGTEMIQQNTGNLLNLVNQILHISKIESGSLPIHFIQGDVVSLTSYIIDSFQGQVLPKNITIHFICQEDRLLMDYDPEKFNIILSNLLSNAIKFSPPGENIYVSLAKRKGGTSGQLEINVKDNGIGIPKDELNLIFERFYQVNNELSVSGIGTGVGLALVKELVELLKGDIQVTSVYGKGTQFTLLLPIHQNAPLINEGTIPIQAVDLSKGGNGSFTEIQTSKAPDESDRPEVLIIEDNADVVRYLQICLQDLYKLTICNNGEAGITEAINSVPDLIMSDVLMPVKDGLAVCRELKLNPVTSHIPIILLSAKTDTASRIAGLESGASVYMVKPFDKDELKAQIQNLLDLYKDSHKRYAVEGVLTSSENPEETPPEDEFIKRVRELVLHHLDNSELTVHDLERGVFLSRSQLHKKLKALTGMSAMQFVSRIRLAKAREYLVSNAQSITDIAYQVGYSDPNYFSRAYSEQFGESPTETRNALKSRT